jgi:DNA-directed RNA polymerase specialized sigma24 family protein
VSRPIRRALGAMQQRLHALWAHPMEQAMVTAANEAPDDPALRRLIEEYQLLATGLRVVTDHEQREELRSRLRAQIELLWPRLQEIVWPLTWGWVYRYTVEFEGSRGQADVRESIGTSMCMHLLDDLATRSLNPDARLHAVLRRIATHRMIDEQRYTQRHAPSRPASARHSPQPASARAPVAIDDESVGRYSLTLTHEVTPQVDTAIFHAQCWEAIRAYWSYRLKPDERLIIQERLRDPATPHEQIGAMLAPPWSAAAVRKRFQRVIDDTRAHLRELGLLPDEQAREA